MSREMFAATVQITSGAQCSQRTTVDHQPYQVATGSFAERVFSLS